MRVRVDQMFAEDTEIFDSAAVEEEVRSNEPADNENVPAGTSTVKSTLRMKRADALALMAESFLQHGAEAMSGGDKFQVVVHVSEEAPSSDRPEPETRWSDCRFEEG